MMITRTLLLVSTLSFLASPVSAQTQDLQPMRVGSLTGTLRIQQPIPCTDDVDQTTPIIGGRLELTPSEGTDVAGGKRFTLTRTDVSFAPFSISRSCAGLGDTTKNYTSVGVTLARAVSFAAASAGGGLYTMTIPKEDFIIYEAVVVNGSPETGYKQPSEDVTGTINFTAGTASFHVKLTTRVHFEGGCTLVGCIVNETTTGSLTGDIAGTIVFPDTDADGVADRVDNCRFVPNPAQTPVATPVIAAPADLTLHSCADHQFGGAKAADVCDAGPVTVTNNAPTLFAVGPNLVTWTATDARARTATDTQTVTIVDTTTPVFTSVPPDLSVYNCGPVNVGTAVATDDCAGTPTITNNAPSYFYVGTTIVTWTATDASGNHTTAAQRVVVTDTVAPTVSCVSSVPLGNSFRVSATDACATPIIRLGSFVLAEGEQIKINETGQPGVRLIGLSNGIRHFQVGRGEAVITATDPSSNVGTAICH